MVHLVHVHPPAREIIIGGQEERPRWGIVGQHPRLGWLIRVVGAELNLRPGLLGVEYHQGVIDGELGKAHQMCNQGRPLIAHLVRFPQLTINHALVIFDAQETRPQIQFSAYDPNQPSQPRMLTYDSPTRTFLLPANDYFPGGRVDVYEVDHKWNY